MQVAEIDGDLVGMAQLTVKGAIAELDKLFVEPTRLGWPDRCVGRIGSVVAPGLGGYLLSIGLPPTQIFLSACAIALVAAIATALRRTMEAAT